MMRNALSSCAIAASLLNNANAIRLTNATTEDADYTPSTLAAIGTTACTATTLILIMVVEIYRSIKKEQKEIPATVSNVNEKPQPRRRRTKEEILADSQKNRRVAVGGRIIPPSPISTISFVAGKAPKGNANKTKREETASSTVSLRRKG